MAAIGALVPAIRQEFRHESEMLRRAEFARVWQIREAAEVEENAVPLAAFLAIPEQTAREIAATDHLFSD